MEREILFRGKGKNSGKWIYGYYAKLDDTSYCIKEDYDRHPDNTKHYIVMDCMTDWGLPNDHRLYEVDPATVAQYTGIRDKDGTMIYEGDILAIDAYPYTYDGEQNYFAEVVCFEDMPGFGLYTFKNPASDVRGISAGDTNYMLKYQSFTWKVIGNIHDNPELMEGRE